MPMPLTNVVTNTIKAIVTQQCVAMHQLKPDIKRNPDVIGKKRLHSHNQRCQIVLEINILAQK